VRVVGGDPIEEEERGVGNVLVLSFLDSLCAAIMRVEHFDKGNNLLPFAPAGRHVALFFFHRARPSFLTSDAADALQSCSEATCEILTLARVTKRAC
jgi:hypothetical protein